MTSLLLVIALIGALLALVTGVRALRAWLRYRRARDLLRHVILECGAGLLSRTGELEKNLSALDSRSQQLPIRIAELQENLTTLRILTSALSISLRQLQRVLSFNALKTLSAVHLSNLFPSRPAARNVRRTD